MKKIAYIIPYFGKFNDYFQLFLNSCKNNPTIDWLIFTDDKTKYDYPNNVKVTYCSFEYIQKKFQEKFDFEICLKRPYKLCDFRPSYGYVFADELKEYDFWGYCDTDMIFGNIRKFYTEDILSKYDKIGFFGHSTLIKNNKKCNEMFMNSIDGKSIYKEVFTTDNGFSFDEEFHNSINDIFVANNMKCLFTEFQANMYRKTSDFKLTKYNFETKKYSIEKKKKNFFVYNNGTLIRYVIKENNKEYLYIHMQSRNMKVKTKSFELFKIIPNSFDDFELSELNNINHVKTKHFNMHYFRHRTKNLIIKIKKRFNHAK